MSTQPHPAEPDDENGAPPAEPTAAGGTRLSVGEIYENVRVTAEEEMHRPASALWWSAIAAGLTIGFSFMAGSYLSTLAPEPLKAAAVAVGYPLGFMFVVLARNQLFTENTLEPIIPLLNTPNLAILRRLLSLWIVVLMGNLAGAVIFSWILADTAMVEPSFRLVLLRVAAAGTSGGFGLVVWRAVFGGWLIALMAWLMNSTRSTLAQLVLIWLTTAPIAAFGFRHSIAGAVETFFRAWMGAIPWTDSILGFLIPALAGNIIGGVVFVALINHGQVAADKAAEGGDPDAA